MIKASELRIGNLVEKDGFWYEADFITIQMAHNYNPIPLTPEILEKCGFDVNEDDGSSREENYIIWFNRISIAQKDNTFALWIGIEEDSWYSFAWTKLAHLHQLQNLYFALTDDELKISL